MQSIGNAVEELNEFLDQHKDTLFVCITEHWKTEDQLRNFVLDNFYLASSFCRRGENEHGGSAVYVLNGVQATAMDRVNSLSVQGQFECAACECRVGRQKVVVISLYNPTSGSNEIFLEKFEEMLAALNFETAIIIIAGDFNIDLLTNSREREEFLSIIQSFNIQHTICQATRITPTRGSCIDNILVNMEDEFESEIIHSMISDHTAQKVTFKIAGYNSSSPGFVYRRGFNDLNNQKFTDRLSQASWDQVFSSGAEQVESQWNAFDSVFTGLFNECFPLRRVQLNKCESTKRFTSECSQKVKECKKCWMCYM